MASEFYKRAHDAAQIELEEALAQRDMLDRRIAKLKQTILSLTMLIQDEQQTEVRNAFVQELATFGITDACRNALKAANSARTAVEIRDWLEGSGYDLSDQANALASIHTVLKRLVESGEAEAVTNAEGKTAYQWKQRPRWAQILIEAEKKAIDARKQNQEETPVRRNSFGEILTEAEWQEREVQIKERATRQAESARRYKERMATMTEEEKKEEEKKINEMLEERKLKMAEKKAKKR